MLNISDFIVFQSSQVFQIRLGFIANRKYKSILGAKYIETLNPIKQNSMS